MWQHVCSQPLPSLKYRVFIKYCVLFLKMLRFFSTLPVLLQRWCSTCPVCVHTLTPRENRESPEYSKIFGKNTIFNVQPVLLVGLAAVLKLRIFSPFVFYLYNILTQILRLLDWWHGSVSYPEGINAILARPHPIESQITKIIKLSAKLFPSTCTFAGNCSRAGTRFSG